MASLDYNDGVSNQRKRVFMTTAIAAPIIEAKPAVAPAALEAEACVLLHGISWEAYEQISNALVDYRGARLNYYQGSLEIMTLSYPHEMYASILGDILKTLAIEMQIDCVSARSTTFKLSPKEAGFEGDDTFYFSYLTELRKRDKQIDLMQDPAPDLVIEVDISNPSLKKFPLLAALGVTEVWRWHDNELTIYQRAGSDYEPHDTSHFLPNVTAAEINELVYAQPTIPLHEWNRMIRDYAQQCLSR
jgi:Uma2 family endonuclease